jgi:hypothetical protein
MAGVRLLSKAACNMKPRKPSYYLWTLSLGIVVYVLGVANMRNGWVVCISNTVNILFCVALVAIPFLLLAIVSSIENIRAKATLIVMLLPSLLLSLFLVLLLGIWAYFGGGDNQRVEIRRYRLPSSQLVLYQYSTGVLGSEWLALRQEKKILPGILLVKRLYDIEDVNDITVNIKTDTTIQIQAPPYSYSRRSNRGDVTIKVKPSVYF